jgi:dipeptidyl aminopeptidase/acylaminoacyl peptidase
VTASVDKTARLWDAANGKPLGEAMKHEGPVSFAQFSANGQRLVTASMDKTARLWDAANGKPLGEAMKHEGPVSFAQFSPDGQRVVTVSEDGTARLWDGTSGKPLGEAMTHGGSVSSAQFSPNGQRLVTASSDMTVRLWDAVIVTNKDAKEDILSLAELAEATGGVIWETVGQAEILTVLTPEQRAATRDKIAAKYTRMSSGLTPLQQWLKWSVSDHRSRAISPFSQVTVSQWLENRIKEGTIEGLRTALQVDPANARITAYLGRCLADQAVKQDSDPDKARRVRGEADFLTSRARKLAPESEEIKRLRDDVIKLLELKTS